MIFEIDRFNNSVMPTVDKELNDAIYRVKNLAYSHFN